MRTQIEELCRAAVEEARRAGASYADARFVWERSQSIGVKNGGVDELVSGEDRGIGIRVIADGAWGFAATANLTQAAVADAARQAVEIAKAAAKYQDRPVELAPQEPQVAEAEHWAKVNPFDVPLSEKIDLLRAIDDALNLPGIVVREATVSYGEEEKLFVSSEGAQIWQRRVVTGAGYSATAADEKAGEVQRRSYPASHGGQTEARGWELVEELKLLDNARPTAEEALELLKADECPEGEFDIILEGSQLALQLHESCGHPIELDRVLGTEASFAGTSFLTLDKLGKFRYGSEKVNIVADATIPGALGSFAFDDEGVPAQRADIVKEGIFVGYLTSRETAAVLGQRSNGAMRADGWAVMPLIRMTNINLLPGDAGTLEDLFRDSDGALYMCTNKSWSIDDKRLNFHFACEVAYLIRNGEVAKIYRNPVYQGITPEFWGSCDAICSGPEWRVWGVPNCGKGEPMQTMEVGHGVAPARFRAVKVRAGR